MPGFQPGVTINEQSQLAVTTGLRASSYEPGFRDLALPLNPLEDFQCVDMRGLASSVSKISVFPTEISVSGLGIFAIWILQPEYWDDSGMNSGRPDGIVLHCLLYFPHHKHPIQLQWYNFKSCRSYDRHESYNIFCCTMFALFLEFGARTHPRIFGYFSSQKPGWNFSYEPKAKCGSGNRASQVNHAHVKRPVSQKFQPLFRPEIKLLLTSHNPKNLANRPAHFFMNWQRIIMLSAKLLKPLSRMWTSRAFRSCIIETF